MSDLGHFAEIIASASLNELEADVTLGGRLVLGMFNALTICYAPFDHIQAAG
jgi:hypothetical protein